MKLDNKRVILVGFAFFSICCFWQMYDNVIPLILKYDFSVKDTLAGVVMALDNVLALFLLPLFGKLSDKIDTKIGRRKPFILTGTACACALMMLLPLARRINSLPMFFTVLMLVLVSMSLYRSPAVALMPDVTPKPLRSPANAIINLMGTVGGVLSLLAMNFLMPAIPKTADDAQKTAIYRAFGYEPVFLIVIGVMLIAALVLLFRVNEPKLREKAAGENRLLGVVEEPEAQNGGGKLPPAVFRSLILLLCSVSLWYMGYNAVTSAFSKYSVSYLNIGNYSLPLLIANGAALAAYIPVGIVAGRVGRKKTILGGVVILAAAFFGAQFVTAATASGPYMIICLALAGIAWATINVNSYPMVVEMARGRDTGKYTGFYYTFSMAAQIATPILSGAVMEHLGYRFLFPYAVVFVCLSFCTMLLVKHGDSRPPARNKLAAFDTED